MRRKTDEKSALEMSPAEFQAAKRRLDVNAILTERERQGEIAMETRRRRHAEEDARKAAGGSE